MTTASQREAASKSVPAKSPQTTVAGRTPPSKKKMSSRAPALSPGPAKKFPAAETGPVTLESCSAGGLLSIATARLKLMNVKSPARRSKSCDSDKKARKKYDSERRKTEDENAGKFRSSSSSSNNSKRQQCQRASASRTTSSDSGSSSVGGESPSEETVSKNIRHYISLTKHMDPNAMLSHMSFQDSSFIRECLHWHNYFRTRHQVPELVLSPQLCASAQEWANLLANTSTFRYRNQKDVGENLFCRPLLQSLGEVTGKEVAIFWYSNIRKYDYTKKPDLLHIRAGSFSQMVWSSSKFFGIAKARSKQNQKIFIVAHYYPPGNVAGRFHENVLPPVHSNRGGEGGGPGSSQHQSVHQFQLASGRKKSKDPDGSTSRGGGTAGERRSNASDETNMTSKNHQHHHPKRRGSSEHDETSRGRHQRASDVEEDELRRQRHHRRYFEDGGGVGDDGGGKADSAASTVPSSYQFWPDRQRGASLSSHDSSHSS